MKHARKLWLGAAAVALTLALGGCDDNDDNDNTPTPSALETAATSVTAFVAFLQGLATGDETSEPLDVNTFTAPTDDAGEPAPVS